MSNPLSDSQRKEIMKRVYRHSRRQRRLSTPGLNRSMAKWFIGRLIDYCESLILRDEPTTAAEVEGLLREARTIALEDRRRWRNLTAGEIRAFRRDWYRNNAPGIRRIRSQIVYGLMGNDAGFLFGAEGLRDFIIERRFRSIMRMHEYVNYYDASRRSGFVFYRSYCNDEREEAREREVTRVMAERGLDRTEAEEAVPPIVLAKWNLNVDTAHIWQYANTERHQHPFILEDSYRTKPDEAIEKLFVEHPTCSADLLDCAMAACAVLIDSLMAAQDPRKLLTTAVDQHHDDDPRENAKIKQYYITVDHPETNWGHYSAIARDYYRNKDFIPKFHIINDPNEHSLFDYKTIKLDGLEVGDRVYLYNHPLYRTFVPGGAWAGEHAFVWNLKNKKKMDIEFEGHGMRGPFDRREGTRRGETIEELYAQHLANLNTWNAMIVGMTAVHLGYLKDHRGESALGVRIVEGEAGPGLDTYVYRSGPTGYASTDFEFTEYDATSGLRKCTTTAFAVIQPVMGNWFYIRNIIFQRGSGHVYMDFHRDVRRRARTGNWNVDELIKVERRKAADEPDRPMHDLAYWGIEYVDRAVGQPNTTKFFKLADFYGRSEGVIRSRIKINDIVDKTLFVTRSERGTGKDATVTRPNASRDPSYISYLKSAGAF